MQNLKQAFVANWRVNTTAYIPQLAICAEKTKLKKQHAHTHSEVVRL